MNNNEDKSSNNKIITTLTKVNGTETTGAVTPI